MPSAARDVFINCPFDDDFTDGFRALVFAVIACGFRVRCALEMEDAAETRIEKLYRIIEQSRYGIHDISRTELDPVNKLPRFNMPLELGIFLGAKRFGADEQKLKRGMVLDRERYRYHKFISDLAGMDLTDHAGDPRRMVTCTRDFLATASRRRTIPTGRQVLDSYNRFQSGLSAIAGAAKLDHKSLVFADLERLVLAWVKADSTLSP
ncbi:MAG TPA: hypothetical protein VF704_02875 [Allosphingosinicella sp.]|jgi:hypothetical protein